MIGPIGITVPFSVSSNAYAFNLFCPFFLKCGFHRLLEIGYGSGIFLPELSRHCDELYGVDCHGHSQSVSEMLVRYNVPATLVSVDAAALPFEDRMFDCVVAVSTMEYVDALDAACLEIKRVLSPDGVFVLVTPHSSFFGDLGLKILTKVNARKEYGYRRQRVVPTLRKHFVVQQARSVPSCSSSALCLYQGLRLGTQK